MNEERYEILPGVWLVIDTDQFETEENPLGVRLPDGDYQVSVDLKIRNVTTDTTSKLENAVVLRNK